jgi:protein-tyrosine phosphatase/membrane-associated phospholipid phosphatase
MGHLYGVGGPARPGLIRRAAVTSVLLSLLFMVVYGSTNWLTAQRPDADVGTWYFAWELAVIPYVPALIIPYMSIDLLFFAAPFLCHDEREQRVLARRVVFAILVAAAFFLLLPLKLAWPGRPNVDGWFGQFVEASCTAPILMEYPHNLFPSLHITLRVILAETYARHTRGWVKVASAVWFSLIGFSTVLTYQHHLVDIAGGVVLAGFAFFLFRPDAARLSVTRNLHVAVYYGTAAVALLALAWPLRPWGAFLLWPAGALAIVAAGYCGLGPGIFHKRTGRLPFSTRFVLVPVLLGQYLSLVYYRRHARAWDVVAPGVWIGRQLSNAEAAEAVRQGVTAVLDLTGEFTEATAFRAVRYCNLPILDLTAPTPEQLAAAVAFVADAAAEGTVYVHCKAGFSRSAAIAGAYLLASGQADSAAAAIAMLQQARPRIIVRSEAQRALNEWAHSRESAELAAALA